MTVIISILKIIFLLGFLILIHEAGHMIVAKLCKVKVNEFSIGFGPMIWHKQGKETKYNDFNEAIDAAKNGEQVVFGGSKGDDVATYEKLIGELGFTKDQMNYVTYDSSGDAITAILGGHIDFVISKPAAADQYVEAGDLVPVLALSTERYTGNMADAPTLSEIGDYDDVEVPVWRAVAAPEAMSEEAVAFWSDAMQKVSESDTWQNDYIGKYKLISNYMNHEDATAYVTQYEADYLASLEEGQSE